MCITATKKPQSTRQFEETDAKLRQDRTSGTHFFSASQTSILTLKLPETPQTDSYTDDIHQFPQFSRRFRPWWRRIKLTRELTNLNYYVHTLIIRWYFYV